ncbi:hypothetical protein [Streptomyces sp. TBY4]|uniref:hypothetical protein n=2 Tax=unclassified Streptomyces TaxID=2593676 RepID=UPI0020B8A4AA|nr:hypothetical protein [Streptomyces sp. TBY4]MCP3754124.1 hypothetical protein [Streptomyces sp. TBY4]
MTSKSRGRSKRAQLPVPVQQSEPNSGPGEALWVSTRSGARAGRGFHYQDAVGAWLCGRILSGALDSDRIVPEGLEDLSCDGPTPWHVQVKSRQERIGDFTAPEVAEHLVAMALAHAKRVQARLEGRPLLVLERPVEGEWFTQWGDPLSDLPRGHRLLQAFNAKASKAGLTKDEIDAWCNAASLYVLPWRAAADDTRTAVAQRLGLLPVAAEAVVLALRSAVARRADANAETTLSGAAGLSRTNIAGIATEVAETIDRASLEEALATGLCEPVDFDRPLQAAGFHEGVNVQPGHITAGLPAPRPVLTGRVADAIHRGQSVLVTGPSGIGKSAVMWTAAYVTRHVLWYRIRRLQADDAVPLVRLARALQPTTRSPVGFVVDGIGIGAAEAWDVLYRELAPIPGVLLLGSVRSEDLLPLRSRVDCTQIEVTLDEEVAEQIHAGLSATGTTAAAHWREAYDAANGLTLEFTHLLTRGRRLSDVLSEQVERRVAEGRQAEIEILARISIAHQWGVDLPVRALQQQLGLGDTDLRTALSRLADEHLVHERRGLLSGLHQLRSAHLADAVHAIPPPILDETVLAVMRILTDSQLQPFIAGVLTEHPVLDPVVLDQLAVELGQRPSVKATTGVLQALRLVDVNRTAADWLRTLDRHRIPPALRRTTLQFALVDGDLLPQLKPEIAAAITEIRAADTSGSPLRNALVERLGKAAICLLLSQCEEPVESQRLLAVLAGTGLDLAGGPKVLADSPFGQLLASAPVDLLGDILSTARTASVPLAEQLLQLAGGEERVLDTLVARSPWVTEASIVDREGSRVAYARLLHVSDQARPDAEQEVRELGRMLLRCLPQCESADIQNLLPGGLPLTIGDFTSGVSLLKRQYDRSPATVAWTRTRTLIGATVAGHTDWTTRTATAASSLPVLHQYLTDLTQAWCVGRGRPKEVEGLRTTQAALLDWAASLTLPVDTSFLSTLPVGDDVPGGGSDHLQHLVNGIAENLTRRLADPNGYAALASYVGDSLPSLAMQVRDEERWHLIGQDPPDVLDHLVRNLADLHAVLAELAWGTLGHKELRAAARSGPSAQALSRAADLARRAAGARAEALPLKLQSSARAAGIRISVYTRPVSDADSTEWPAAELAVGVELAELTQWPTAVEQLCSLLKHDPGSQGSRRAVLLVPFVDGKPVRLMAQQLQTALWPGTGLFDAWSTELPEGHPTPLTDAAIDAHQALQCLSGLAHLATLRDTDARHQSTADEAVAQFQQARSVVGGLRQGDPVIAAILDFLDTLARRVEREIAEGPAFQDSGVANLASAIAQGATAHPTEDYLQLDGMTAITLQWDLDPDHAARLFAATDG